MSPDWFGLGVVEKTRARAREWDWAEIYRLVERLR